MHETPAQGSFSQVPLAHFSCTSSAPLVAAASAHRARAGGNIGLQSLAIETRRRGGRDRRYVRARVVAETQAAVTAHRALNIVVGVPALGFAAAARHVRATGRRVEAHAGRSFWARFGAHSLSVFQGRGAAFDRLHPSGTVEVGPEDRSACGKGHCGDERELEKTEGKRAGQHRPYLTQGRTRSRSCVREGIAKRVIDGLGTFWRRLAAGRFRWVT